MNKSHPPHLFEEEKIWQKELRTYDCVLFFTDYDGTLADFHSDPAQAYPLSGIPDLLAELKKCLPQSPTIITGRRPEEIRELMPEPTLPTAGLHGLLYLPEDEDRAHPLLDKLPQIPAELEEILAESAVISENLRIEDKGRLKALHFDQEDMELKAEIGKKLEDALQDKEWEGISGRRVLEIRPENWHKGRAVKTLRRNYAERLDRNPGECIALYLGDDRTDEDVFRNLSSPGLTICVENEKSRKTAADYSLISPSEVKRFLQVFSEIINCQGLNSQSL